MAAIDRRALLLGALSSPLAACATSVENTQTYVAGQSGPPLPRPAEILVYDFVVDWRSVQLDQGIRARLERQNGEPSEDQQQVAAEVQAAIAETLVEQIKAMGLRAVRATASTRPRPGDVIVGGQIVKVDAGNATRRNLIGFGAGKSEVFANVEVYEAAKGERNRLLQTYDADANSGRTPGLGLGAASAAAGNVGLAAAGTVVGTASRYRTGLPQDGEHLAKRVARNLGQFFSQQGWIDPASVPSISR